MTAIPSSSLVLTKLRIPAQKRQLIHRPQLLELLSTGSEKGFVLVSAPAGYGKTTLLTEWARSQVDGGVTVAWYTIDASDDSAGAFRAYLIAAPTQALGPIPDLERVAEQLRSSAEADLSAILPAVINSIVACQLECALILDDYHLITSPAIHSALAYLLEHLPENLHITIGSRSDPPLPLARLRARGQMLEARAAHLRFTPDETACLLNEVMQLDLTQEMIEFLSARSEGWAAGLQLAALSLAGRRDKESFLASFSGSNRYLVEYLLNEVVGRQPEEVQSFLLSSSILERMCAPLCDALLVAGSHSGAILEQIERANLFVVPLDDQGEWYRFHHLFRDFLKARLEKSGAERVSVLHRRASEWLAAQGFLREAADHAFRAHDWEYAAAFVERHSFTMIVHSEISTIYEWCSIFPEDVMQRRPLLSIQYCLSLAYSYRRQNREKVQARLEQVDKLMDELEDRQLAGELFELSAVVHTFLAMVPDTTADPRELLSLAQKILSTHSEGDPGQFSGLLLTAYAYMALQDVNAADHALKTARKIALGERLYFGYVETSFHLARLAYTRGELHSAGEICRQGRAEMEGLLEHAEQELPALGCLDIALGCTLLEQDRLDEAGSCLRRGLELVGWKVNLYYLMTGLVGLARLGEIQRRPAEAVEPLNRLEEAWPDMAFCTRALSTLMALRGRPEDTQAQANAGAWLREHSNLLTEATPPAGMGPFGAAEAFYLVELASIRFQIAAGQAQATLPVLEHRLKIAQKHGLSGRVIELSLLEALARHAAGDEERALQALERALALGEAKGFVRIFDQGPAVVELLARTARRGVYSEYIGRLLAASGLPGTVPSGEQPGPQGLIQVTGLGLVETLSQRELEVLRLIAMGASNQLIAEQLVITIGTVKSHINHLLRKLDVRNRTEAVARARQLGWLDF